MSIVKTEHVLTNKEVKQTLHAVIESLVDGREGFQKIGGHLKNETLRRYFAAESLKRGSFRDELERMLHEEGDRNAKQSGSMSGTLRRTWGDLKAHLGGGDHTLLETAEAGEDAAKKAYKEALDKNLPSPITRLLTSQYAHIASSHDYVKAARDRHKGAVPGTTVV
jgi:uncharacterized protein (TIGR02284 family)